MFSQGPLIRLPTPMADSFHSGNPPSAVHQPPYGDSPSSLHSSPQAFATEHDSHSSAFSYPSLTRPPNRRPHNSFSSTMSLHVSTDIESEHDLNEATARPGNAHKHAQFHMSISSQPGDSHFESAQANGSESDDGASHHRSDVLQSRSQDGSAPASVVPQGLSRPLTPQEDEKLAYLERLKQFLASAPSYWDSNDPSASSSNSFANNGFNGPAIDMVAHRSMALGHAPPHPQLNRFLLPSQEFVTCVLWNGLYHITGTDIVRALVFRFDVGIIILLRGTQAYKCHASFRLSVDRLGI
jgi:transcription factor STE12